MSDFLIRTCSRVELELVLSWAAAEGWNPGKHDALPFHLTDPSGFLIGLLDGQPIAAISAVRYADNFGFIGLFLVRPDQREQGFGLQMWNAALWRLRDCVIGLDGVVAQQANYARNGFQLAFRQIRYGGAAPATGFPSSLVDLRETPFDLIMDYDKEGFPVARPAFLAAWIAQPASKAVGVLRGKRLGGFGVRRSCLQGHKVGPLFADDEATAEQILHGLCADVAGQPIFLDVPEPNAPGRTLAERHGLQPVFEAARMYRGGAKRVKTPRVFGTTTLELG